MTISNFSIFRYYFWTLKLWILLNILVLSLTSICSSLSALTFKYQISKQEARTSVMSDIVKIFQISPDYIDNDLFSNFFNNMDSFVETDKLWKKLKTQCSKIWSLLFVLHHQDELWIGHSAILVHIKLLDGFLGFLHLNVCEIKMSQSPPDYLPCLPGTPRR